MEYKFASVQLATQIGIGWRRVGQQVVLLYWNICILYVSYWILNRTETDYSVHYMQYYWFHRAP